MHIPIANSGPSRTWYVLAVMIVLVAGIGTVLLIVRLASILTSGEQFFVPGTYGLTVERPGTYVLWNDAETFFQGRQYSSSDSLPDGMTIKVIHEETRKEVPCERSLGSSESSGTLERYSICEFRAETPGKYTIAVAELPEERVFMVRRSLLGEALISFLVCAALSVAGWIGGPLLIIFVAVKRSRAKTQQARL